MYDSRKDTQEHIMKVGELLTKLQVKLEDRKRLHDHSKLKEPEKAIFDEFTPKLKNCTYGSDEYKGYLGSMKIALDHHYAENRHHPEHFENGIQDMNIVDICEMIADWKAASLRHADGDIMKSIEINQKRFGYSDELKNVLINTVKQCFD
jgi:hypothetical protein